MGSSARYFTERRKRLCLWSLCAGRTLSGGARVSAVAARLLIALWCVSINPTQAWSATVPSDESVGYVIGKMPSWVKPTPAFDPLLEPLDQDSHGYHTRLSEFQYNGVLKGQSSQFWAKEYRLTNAYGVENHSRVEISFDPAYETLTLHELIIKRGDTLIDKLPSARFDLLRTESDRSKLIYNGSHTLAVVLDDVRIGDTVRYAYTVAGENPIFFAHREFYLHTELAYPVDRQYARVLSASDKPFNRRVRGKDVPMVVTEENGVQEIIIDQHHVPSFTLEHDVPSWHYNRGTIVFSDMNDWRSVVEWALPLYQLPDAANAEIISIAAAITASHNEVGAQIGAALRWVQEEVRYFGVELGKSSHLPSMPAQTLARRYGDCKDKALLLIALLKELGIQAQPALVNTGRALEASNYPYRMHAFDHVIVHVQHEGNAHFMDPTRRNQAGALGDLYEPDYGRALVLAPDTTGLTQMGNARAGYTMASVKTLTLPAAPHSDAAVAVPMQVSTTKRGLLAERMRGSFESKRLTDHDKDYVDYYRGYFSALESVTLPVVTEESGNALHVVEQYLIPQFWQSDENFERFRWLYADEIIGYLDSPDDAINRQQPYELVHPITVEETWTVSLPEPLRLEDLDAQLANQWMSFSKRSTLSEDGRQLSVTFRYRTLANEVAADDLVAYAESVDLIEDMASFYIEDEPVHGVAMKLASDVTEELAKAGGLSVLSLVGGVLLLLFRQWSRRFRSRSVLFQTTHVQA